MNDTPPPKAPLLFDADEAAPRAASRPLIFEHDGADPAPDPSLAPPVPEIDAPYEGRAMRAAIAAAGRERRGFFGGLGMWILGAGFSLILMIASISAWDWALSLTERVPLLGGIAWVLMAIFGLGLLVALGREWFGWRRLARLDRLHAAASAAHVARDPEAAREVAHAMARHYGGRAEGELEPLDADAILNATERRWLAAADAAAQAEIASSARQVALMTAIVPLALADVAAALLLTSRMIRRIATIYGGRPGALGNWRLLRSVVAQLAATGAVAVGDDMIGSVAGGGLLAKLSRRFGEGVVNGALSARVGIAAMEVCRPMPFVALPRPGVSALTARALQGLFQR